MVIFDNMKLVCTRCAAGPFNSLFYEAVFEILGYCSSDTVRKYVNKPLHLFCDCKEPIRCCIVGCERNEHTQVSSVTIFSHDKTLYDDAVSYFEYKLVSKED